MSACCANQVTCKLFYFVQNLTYSCSVLILTLISLERYVAIKHPMLNRRFGLTRAVHGVVIGAAWLLSAVYSLPWLVAYDIVTTGTDAAFCFNTLPLDTRIYAFVNFFVLYIAPLVFMTFVYVRISIVLWRSGGAAVQSLPLISLQLLQHQDCGHQQQQTASRGSSSRLFLNSSIASKSPCLGAAAKSSLPSHSRLRASSAAAGATTTTVRNRSASELALPGATATFRRPTPLFTRSNSQLITFGDRPSTTDHNPLTSRRKVVRLLAAIVTSFALCMLPHHVRVQWQQWSSASYSSFDMYIPPVTTLVFYVNSCLNPLLYALISDKFRQAFADLRWCRCSAAATPAAPPLTQAQALPTRRPVVRCNSQSY